MENYTQFIMANENQTREALRRARKWIGHPNQKAFTDGKHIAAVAEYILNDAGYTMYEMNAPKAVKVS